MHYYNTKKVFSFKFDLIFKITFILKKCLLFNNYILETIIYNWQSQRIDQFLIKYFDYSRNFFHHIISRWWILVNWKAVKKSYKLKNNDKILIDDLQRYLSPEIFEDNLSVIDIPIVFEHEDFLIINKPKWVLSHPNSIRDIKTPNVVAFLYQKYKNLPTINNFIRAGLVHRLDKNTNWLMIIAKTEKWLKYLKNLFDQKSQATSISDKETIKLKKYYKALSLITEQGQLFLNNIIKLPFYIIQEVKAKVPYSVSKLWITKILNFNKISDSRVVLDLEILTWRTHQIRIHLSQNWLPIINDSLYCNEFSNLEDIKLTAYKLEFEYLDWQYYKFEIPVEF